MSCLGFLIPFFTQAILLIRIFAVYPPRRQTLRKSIVIYGILAAILICRLVNMIIWFHHILSAIRTSEDAFIAWQAYNTKLELFLQLFYDLCVALYSPSLKLTAFVVMRPLYSLCA